MEEVLFGLQVTIYHEWKPLQEHRGKNQGRTTVDWFASRLIFSYLSYTAQEKQPRGWYYLQWAKPSYTNYQSRKCLTDLPTSHLMQALLQLRFLFPGVSS